MSEPELGSVDELCRLVLAARRLGCQVHLSSVDPQLLRLLALAGVDALVTASSDADTGTSPRLRRCRGVLRAPAPPVKGPVL